jgi:hypothetical protein
LRLCLALGHPPSGGKRRGFAVAISNAYAKDGGQLLKCGELQKQDTKRRGLQMRTSLPTILGGSLMTALSGSSAMARVSVYYHVGSWDAFSGAADDGKPVCGIGSTNPVDNRSVSLRVEIGDDTVQFEARKPTWNIPADTPITVVIQIGLESPWNMQGAGDGRAVKWTVDSSSMPIFDAQFRRASSLTLNFPSGNEPSWTVGLNGSTAISNAFGRCVTDLSHRTGTQVAPSAPTQPFGHVPPEGTSPLPPAPSRAPR